MARLGWGGGGVGEGAGHGGCEGTHPVLLSMSNVQVAVPMELHMHPNRQFPGLPVRTCPAQVTLFLRWISLYNTKGLDTMILACQH